LATSNKSSDKELMLEIANFDSNAFGHLYDRYSALLYTLIKKIVGDQKTAEDTLSNIFLIIWKRAQKFDPKINNVYAWLMLLTRNKAIDVLKRKRGDHGLPEYNEEYEINSIIPKLSTEIGTIELENAMKMSGKIKGIINSLTDAQKLVLDLSYYEGLSDKGISGKLKIPASTVKIKLQSTMGILMQKLTN
jgi:RNA polymerase sigma-70 factor (ECF subfamily)